MLQAARSLRRAGAAGPPAPSHQLTFRNSTQVLPDASSYAWTSQAIGTANADRVVIVTGYAGGDSTLNLSVDVGGNTASEIYQASTVGETLFAFYVIVSSGTTATITISSTTIIRILDMGYWTCLLPVGEGMQANNALISTTNSATISASSLNIPDNGFAIAFGFERSNFADMTMSMDQSFVERSEAYSATTHSNICFDDREVGSAATPVVTLTLNAASAKRGILVASFGTGG